MHKQGDLLYAYLYILVVEIAFFYIKEMKIFRVYMGDSGENCLVCPIHNVENFF